MANLKNITDLPVAESADGLNLIVNDNGAAKQIAASAVGAQADWAVTDENSPAFVKNKPEVTQPDWNQNDPTAPDYVKNRPFYEETVQKSETREINDSLTDADFATLLVANRQTAVFGDSNGKTYTYLSDVSSSKHWVVHSEDAEDDKPIRIIGDTIAAAGLTSITVNYEEETVHKLDAKYLPDDVGGGGNLYAIDATGQRFYKAAEDMSNDDVVKIINEWAAGNARIFIFGSNTLSSGGAAARFEVVAVTLISGDSSGNTVDVMASYLQGTDVQQVRIGGNYGSIDSTLFDMAKI